jgi:hypothetical protein
MVGLDGSISNDSEQVNANSTYLDPNSSSKTALEEDIDEIYEEIEQLENEASEISRKPKPKSFEKFSKNVKKAREKINYSIRDKYGYNPPKEMIFLHAQVEKYMNERIKVYINRSEEYRLVMNDLNELQSLTYDDNKIDENAKIRIKKIVDKLNNTSLELPISHPGMPSKGFKIQFSSSDIIGVIKSEAGRFYSQCESIVNQIFIFIQKLFNDLLSIFDTAKNSLRNDPINTMVRNQNK